MAELIGLNVNDIQLTTCELRVTGKRNKQRVVPFGLELYEALVKYLHVRQQFYGSSEGPVFITQKRQRINRRQVGIIVKRYLSLVTTQKKKVRTCYATPLLRQCLIMVPVWRLFENCSDMKVFQLQRCIRIRRLLTLKKNMN